MNGFLPYGTARSGDFVVEVTPEQAGWAFSGLRVVELEPGGSVSLDTAGDELIVLPLSGGCITRIDDQEFALAGRDDVFSGITDFAYAPRDAHVDLFSRERLASDCTQLSPSGH